MRLRLGLWLLFFVLSATVVHATGLSPRVLVMNYVDDPLRQGQDVHALINQNIVDLNLASHGTVQYVLAEWLDLPGVVPHDSDTRWRAILRDGDVLAKVRAGTVDEVWVTGTMTCESIMVGENAYTATCPPLVIQHVRDFLIQGMPCIECYAHRADYLIKNALRGAGNWNDPRAYIHYYGACGTVHNPPNARYEYDAFNTVPVLATCEDWLNNWPNLTGAQTLVGCAEVWSSGWNCDYDRHKIWWMFHLSYREGASFFSNWSYTVQNNWWKYVVDFNSYPESVAGF